MDPPEVIEAMTAGDLDDVLAIEQASFDDPWPEQVFSAELRHCWSRCLVLRPAATEPLVGYLVFWHVVDEVHLLNIAVDPACRHRRYGRMLLDHLRAFAAGVAARFITLEVRRSNAAAIGLYESAGFKKVGVRPAYYSRGAEDAVVMLFDLGSTSQVGPLPPGEGAARP